MRALGVPEQYINAGAEADQDEDEPDTPPGFRVWAENWGAVQVFLLCTGSFEFAVTMSGLFYIGLKNTEIEIAMRLMKIHEDKQLGVLRDVSYMADVYAEAKNRD